AAMTLLPVTVKAAPDDGVWRLGWVEAPISYNQVEPETFEGSSAGRYSLFSYGTLYCASRPAGCYAEGLAKFRLSPKVRGLMAGTAPGPGQMALRDIPSSWRDSRILVRLRSEERRVGEAFTFMRWVVQLRERQSETEVTA